MFPSIVNLLIDKFQSAVSRILQVSLCPVMTICVCLSQFLDDSLIAIHVIDPDKEVIPLKKVC